MEIPMEILCIDTSSSRAYVSWARVTHTKNIQDNSNMHIHAHHTVRLEETIANKANPEIYSKSHAGHTLRLSRKKSHGQSQNAFLCEAIECTREAVRGNYDALSAIVINTGPGSFTGLRISMALAKGLVAGLFHKPAEKSATASMPYLIGIPYFDLLAETYHNTYPSSKIHQLLLVMDSRSNKFYSQLFDERSTAISNILDLSAEDTIDTLSLTQDCIIGGYSGDDFLKKLSEAGITNDYKHITETISIQSLSTSLLNMGIKGLENRRLSATATPLYIRNHV